jgi:putative long chain acyl-CoA synthase
MFAYQVAAFRRAEGVDSVVTFGSPVDTRAAMPFGLPEQLAVRGAEVLGSVGGSPLLSVPAWVSRTGFRLLDPVKSLQSQLAFVRQLSDREALLPRERQRRFLEGEGWVAWPGPALADFLTQFIAHNRMLEGGFVIEDRLVTLADVTCPILAFVGEVDQIAPVASVRAIRRAAPRADVFEAAMPAGHFGLVVGSAATGTSWPTVAAWAAWRGGKGSRPSLAKPMADADADGASPGALQRVGYGLDLVAGASAGVARSLGETAVRTARGARELARETTTQLPRLARLELIQPNTRVSLGLLLDEQAERSPGDVFFLFEDRAHTHRAVKERIDNVVRGLLSAGVRQGEHVGLLMHNRPSALAVAAALNRIGAVSVLLRPDGDLAREAELGGVTRVVADPEHAEAAAVLGPVHTFVLGGGGRPRDLGAGLTDLERVDPAAVTPPAWYRPNPGRAVDLAFLLFTGAGERTRVVRVTNRRWALSAFGTASSASIGAGDTVYSMSALYHASALLTSIGAAVAGGGRLAMAAAYDPATFWDEVRRYGVTVVSYTWTMLRDLALAPRHPGEAHHPVRLFIGSGMPPGLWRRVMDRFAPARVLEFYASSEGEGVLVNVSGSKAGALGRPLPGSAELRLVAYDLEGDRLVEGDAGYARPCPPGEVGLLLSRTEPGANGQGDVLRSVFRRDDAWLSTGDLFRQDADGDFWLVDRAASVVRTADGPVPTVPIRDALETLPAVDLAVAYAVAAAGDERAVAALTLLPGARLEAADLDGALAGLAQEQRPSAVRLVGEIPVTTWFRPRTELLRREGLPAGEPGFRLDAGTGAYRPR